MRKNFSEEKRVQYPETASLKTLLRKIQREKT